MTAIVHAVTGIEGAAAGAELVQALAEKLGDAKPALVVCFASMAQPLGALLATLRDGFEGAPTVGLSTAGEFTEKGEHHKSAIAVAIVGDFIAHTAMTSGVKHDPDAAAQALIAELPPTRPSHPHRTALLFFDGLAGVGEELTLSCAMRLGPGVQVAGAAAGDDWAIQGTLVGAQNNAAVDGAALAVIDSTVALGIGVAHGHRATGRRVRVTRAEGSVVHELDGQPAWKRYAELTRDLGVAKQGVDPDAITDAGARLQFFAWYQTGINLGDSYKNRTPLGRLADDSMAFACGIAEGTELEVLQSTTDAQVESAREAARQAAAKLGDHKVSGALVFECACRQVYLGERFGEAPRAVSDELGGAPLAGLEAYGEVALNVGDFSGFHNATTVVLAFPEAP